MKERILCVDDEPVVLAVLKHQLGNEFDVTIAGGGKQGLQAIEDHGSFAVIIADYGMPGMNGLEFLSQVRSSAPNTVRILLTGDGTLQSITNALNDGTLFRFLTKPCPTETFREAVTAAVEQYRKSATPGAE